MTSIQFEIKIFFLRILMINTFLLQGTAAAAIVATLVIGCGVGSVISNALVNAL